MKLKKSMFKYVGLIGMSILTAACSIFLEEIANEEIATDAAEKAAKATVEEYRRTESKGNRAQRRHPGK